MCLSVLVFDRDLAIEQGEFTEYEYAITHNYIGYRCGYIKLLPNHPWYGLDCNQIPAVVHGGLTFAKPDIPCGKDGADDGWWIGFDCAHLFDAPDPDLLTRQPVYFYPLTFGTSGTIRSTDYVREQIHQLITQAVSIANV